MSAIHIVRKLKYDRLIKSKWQGEFLGLQGAEWLVIAHRPQRHLKFSGGKGERSDLLFVHCLNLLHPLTVLLEFEASGQFRGAKCDAALPATRDASVIEFVDLDLDLIVEPDLSYRLRDEDTFARNRIRMGYTETVVQQAWAGIALGERLLALRQFPFDGTFVPKVTMPEMTIEHLSGNVPGTGGEIVG